MLGGGFFAGPPSPLFDPPRLFFIFVFVFVFTFLFHLSFQHKSIHQVFGP
jgi:hypothetical protein